MNEPGTASLVVRVEGVVVPPWVAACVLVAGLLNVLAFGAVTGALLLSRSEARAAKTEMRLLQLHVQDVESVLIRDGIAKRQDFAAWGQARPLAPEDKEEMRKNNSAPREAGE